MVSPIMNCSSVRKSPIPRRPLGKLRHVGIPAQHSSSADGDAVAVTAGRSRTAAQRAAPAPAIRAVFEGFHDFGGGTQMHSPLAVHGDEIPGAALSGHPQ